MKNEDLLRTAPWRKSTYSDGGNHCLEGAGMPGQALVRDTKDRERGILAFSERAWATLVNASKR